jgi:uncharacterized protein (TIGR03435 family)
MAALPVLAQAPAFDAATIRPAAPDAPRPAGASTTPERLILRNTTLENTLGRALAIISAQIDGPAWISTDRYDINAKAPDHTPPDQVLVMLQNLLIERFKLELHHETRELAVYALVAGKGKLKMEESAAEGPRDTFDMTGGRRAAHNMSMAGLVQYVSMTVRTPVVDRTELKGHFNFPFEMSSEELGATQDHPSIFTIVEKLGLKLESRKLPFDVIVIDRGDKMPVEN